MKLVSNLSRASPKADSNLFVCGSEENKTPNTLFSFFFFRRVRMHFSKIKHNSCYFDKFGGQSLVAVLASGKQKHHAVASFCQVQKLLVEKIILEKSLLATTEIPFHFPASMLVHTRGLLFS